MTNKTRSVLVAVCAISSAGLATQLVPWHTLPKACLAGAVAGMVVTVLMFTLPMKPDNTPKPPVDIG